MLIKLFALIPLRGLFFDIPVIDLQRVIALIFQVLVQTVGNRHTPVLSARAADLSPST